jgi:chromosome segregation ATPase
MDALNVPLNRADLAALSEELAKSMGELEIRLDASIKAVAERVLESIFHLAEALQSRVTDLERSDANLKHRLAMMEERLTELEKKLHLPPERVQ